MRHIFPNKELSFEDAYVPSRTICGALATIGGDGPTCSACLRKQAAVNIIDRPEPGVGSESGAGDASVLKEDAFSSVPLINRPEENSNPAGSAERDFGMRRRTEGSGFGNNLTDLTVAEALHYTASPEGEFAVSDDEFIAKLNDGIGLEYSQHLRYLTYASTLRLAFREALAEEFVEHADKESEHAQILSRRVVALGGKLDFKVAEPVVFDPTDPNVLEKILAELWQREQSGLTYYRELLQMCGKSVFSHTVEEILVTELEHNDDIKRFGYSPNESKVATRRLAEVVNQAPLSQPEQWKQSYHDENAFEGLDKMGDCATCGESLHGTDIHDCPMCSSRQAILSKYACFQCVTSGRLVICGSCSTVYNIEPIYWNNRRVAAWIKRADAVKRKMLFGGLPIHIEYNAGDTKTYENGNSRQYRNDYGFIPGTVGADGEPIDVYMGHYPSHQAHVVSQLKPDGSYDEDKVMLGFQSPEHAEAAYRQHYPNNGEGHFGGMKSLGMEQFISDYCQPSREDPWKPKLIIKQVPLEVITAQKVKVKNPQTGWVGWVNPENADKYEPAVDSDSPSDTPNEFSIDPSPNDVDEAVKQVQERSKLAPDQFRVNPLPQDVEAAVNEALNRLDSFVKQNPDFALAPDQVSVTHLDPSQTSGNPTVDKVSDAIVASVESPEVAKEVLPAVVQSISKSSPVAGEAVSALAETLAKAPTPEDAQSALKEVLADTPIASRYSKTETLPQAKPKQKLPQVAPPKAPSQSQPMQPQIKPKPDSVDMSEAISPVEQEWQKERGKLKELWSQMWRLIGGPGYQPGPYLKESAKEYEMPDHGPLGNDGEIDHPVEDKVTTYA
jgi:bacterioferritin (cytochrome b1)